MFSTASAHSANSTIQQLVCVPGLTPLRAKVTHIEDSGELVCCVKAGQRDYKEMTTILQHCYQTVSVCDSRNYYVCRRPNIIVSSLRDRFSPLDFITDVHSATKATFRDNADSSS
ncbi:hypothetical protein BC629DRAFT_1438271 [Irpex lacteus]|nr:hypothetical protein BC629DRAFT_1438271 [Irpex lacteus]